jgi:hypothetical protein
MSLQSIENKGLMLSILCKVFKTSCLVLFHSSDKNTRRLAGLLACVVSIVSGVSSEDVVSGLTN